MKMVLIRPVAKPKSFADVKFTEADWKKAEKIGELEQPYGTAMENVRLSKGLYELKPVAREIPAQLAGPKDPYDMSKEELVMEMTAWGKPPRKQMPQKACIEFILKLRSEAAELITDDEDG